MKPTSVERVRKPTFEDVRRWFDENLDAERCDLDDQEVYRNVYHEGRWAAVFQFTEKGAQRFAERAKPKSIVDIAAITSIYRPGPLTANVDKAYVSDKERVESGEALEYEHPVIEQVLAKTYGHMVFQEDFMRLGNQLGKLSWDDCDALRKILVKKSIGTDVNDEKRRHSLEIKERFKEGAVANGMTEEGVEELWRKMEFFSGYGFNASFTDSCRVNTYTREGIFRTGKVVSRIEPGDYVRSRDEKTGDECFVEIAAVHDHGTLNVFEYEFSDGSKVTCTQDHKFRTTDGRMLPMWKILEEDLDVVSARHEGITLTAVCR